MKNVNLFKSNLTGKQLVSEKSETKKAVRVALADFAKAIDGAFSAVIKSDDRRARNVANAAKGKFHTALQVVGKCYPYQTADGVLCCKKAETDENGLVIRRYWAEKKLTAAAARSIVRSALDNFTSTVGEPVVTIVTLGDTIPEKK